LNTIFVLSIARRHGVSREDSAWDDAGLPQLKRGLAVFGASEFDRLDPLGPFGSEQAAQLAFEICWAAIDETRIDIFSRFATRLREAIADLNQRQAGPIANEVKTLKAHARKRYGRSGPWLRALAELS
ncbi:MAG: hypothetical protein JWM33_3234, partial [Caulobacteraceae bacterium]|nr:hypothetical protein [Caulobacteraceae bacterium]